MKSVKLHLKVLFVLLTACFTAEAAKLVRDRDISSSASLAIAESRIPYPMAPLRVRVLIDGVEIEKEGRDLTDIITQFNTQFPGYGLYNATAKAEAMPEDRIAGRDLAALFCYPVPGQPWKPSPINVAGEILKASLDPFTFTMHFLGPFCSWVFNTPNHLGNFQLIVCAQYGSVEIVADYLATVAFNILSNCQSDDGRGHIMVGGQQFETSGYDVIIASNY